MITVQNTIIAALRTSTVISHGQIPNASELTAGTDVLKRMTDLWSTDSGNIFNWAINLYTLTNQKQSYTIGVDPAGILVPDLVGARPLKIVRANVLFSGTPAIRRPLKLLTDAEWADKRLQLVYSIPFEIYNAGGNPLSTLYFYPVPDAAYQIELFTPFQLTTYANLTDNIIVPPGYEEALVTNLAVRLALEFGKPIRPELMTLATQSKASIQSLNTPRLRLKTDPALRGRGGYYNYRTGQVE